MENKDSIRELLKSAESSIFARIELIKLYVLYKKKTKIDIDTTHMNSKLFEVAYKNAEK